MALLPVNELIIESVQFHCGTWLSDKSGTVLELLGQMASTVEPRYYVLIGD